MNSRDTGEWPDVERREGERREVGPPQPVTVDGLSNGALEMVETAINEARQTRKELEVADKEREAQWDRAVRMFARGFAAVCGTIIVSAFGIGIWVNDTARDIEARPTTEVTRQMVEQAKLELLDEVAENTAKDELRADGFTEGFQKMRELNREMRNQIDSLRRDFRREHGRG